MTEQPGANPVPEWRRGAIYHRPLTDADGYATGIEVTVYPTLFGNGRFCVGRLAAQEYEHEYNFDTPAEAVEAAKVYDGNGPPTGKWSGYKSRSNGDVIPSEEAEPTELERRDVVGGLMGVSEATKNLGRASRITGESVKEFAKRIAQPKPAPFQRTGQGETSISIEADDEIQIKHNFAAKQTIVTIERTTFEVHDRPAPTRTIYRAVLEYDGEHDFKVGARLRVNQIEKVVGV